MDAPWYKKVFEVSPVGMALIDGDFKLFKANDAFCRFLGYSEAELKKKTFRDMPHPEDNDHHIEEAIKLRSGELSELKTEKRYIRKDQKVVWGEVNASVINDKENNFLHYLVVLKDISDRKKTELELAESEERFRAVFEKSNDAILMTSPDGTVQSVNARACELFGMTEKELMESGRAGVIDTSDPRLTAALAERERTGAFFGELNYKKKDGTIFPAEFSSVIYKDKQGRGRGVIIIRDISERKQNEEKLLEREKDLFAILDSSNESIHLADTEGKVLIANKTAAERLGVRVDDLIGRNIFSFFPPHVVESRKKALKEVVERKELLHVLDQREGLILSSTIYPIFTGDKVTRVAIFSMNISEIKKKESEMLRTESQLKSILESAGTGLLAVDHNGKVMHTNSLFAKMWEIPENMVKAGDDQVLLDFVLPLLKNPDEFIAKVRQLYQSDAVSTDIVTLKNGKIFERTSHPQIMNDKIAGRTWGFRDITKQKEAEFEVQRVNNELTELNAMKDKFFSIIAHDLKSPFSNIFGFSELLVSDFDNFPKEEVRRFLSIIDSSARRAHALLDNLLVWSLSQRGKLDFTPVVLDLKPVITEAINLTISQAEAKSISLSSGLKNHLYIYADRNMIDLILRNLITNAIKYTPRNGMITVDVSDKKEFAEIIVRDTGIGMPNEVLADLFRIDRSISTPGTEREKGSGLGLILCKEFVEKHQGSILVESTPGKGSAFCINLPKGFINI